MNPSSRGQWRPWHVVGAVAVFYVGVTLARFGGDPLAFATLCPDPQRIATGRCGYDGQFAYAIAVDPDGSAPRMDVPAYRYQRILYPMLARVVGLGQAGLIAWALILINLIALAAGTAILEAILVEHGSSRWHALAYGLFAGALMPVRLDLTEPLAYALALSGVWSALRGRCLLSGVLLALAALTKETTLLLAAGIVGAQLARHAAGRAAPSIANSTLVYDTHPERSGGRSSTSPSLRSGSAQNAPAAQRDTAPHVSKDAANQRGNRSIRCALAIALIAVAPFAIWQFVLRAQFGQFGIGSGGALGTPFEFVPLRGWWSIASIDLGAFAVISLIMLPMAIVPALLGLWAALRDFARRRLDLPAWLLFFNAAIVLFTPQSTFREPLGMARLIVGLVVSALIYAAARGSRRGLNYSLLWIFTLALALNE